VKIYVDRVIGVLVCVFFFLLFLMLTTCKYIYIYMYIHMNSTIKLCQNYKTMIKAHWVLP